MASQERSLVARRIEEIRTAKGLSRQDLADRVTLPPRGRNKHPRCTYLQVYRVEMGEVDISVDDASAYAEALDVSVTSLYRESKAAS